ncbi:MAG TPA: TRAP transporter small permease [Hyphomicrobiaceae bacterium]|nr:TRAP transporter small permease [Hyphomicrobiaceae bacterium]
MSVEPSHPERTPRLLRLEEAIAAAVMAVLGLITLANVVVRYLTNYSFAFTEEYSIALMVVVAMLGASIAAARNRHMRITWFVERLPRPLALACNHLAMLASAAMFALLVGLGGKLAWDEYRFEVLSPGLGEPQWIYTLALPLFSVLVLLRVLGWWWRHRNDAHAENDAPPGAEV